MSLTSSFFQASVLSVVWRPPRQRPCLALAADGGEFAGVAILRPVLSFAPLLRVRRACGRPDWSPQALPASGLLSGGFEDQPRDFLRVPDQREMAGLHLDGPGIHPLGHEALKVRMISLPSSAIARD